MKLHSQRVKDDFESYYNDLRNSVLSSLEKPKDDHRPNLFKQVYPLFVILETLYNPNYFIDPSTEIEFSQSMESGDRDKAFQAIKKLSEANRKMSVELKKGLETYFFTPFFGEMYSDALLLVNQYYLNNYRGCYLYLRALLEDVYKHIFYVDHKAEFIMVTVEEIPEYDLDITPQALRIYLGKTPRLHCLKNLNCNLGKLCDREGTIFSLNEELYKKTSAFVHPSSETFMSHFTSNSDLLYNGESALRVIETTKGVIKITLIFLICAHFKQFARFNEFEKSLVISGLKNEEKSNLRRNLGL